MRFCGILSLGFFVSLVATLPLSAEPPRAPVPPTLEIEVLDPGVDPLGNPAVIPRVGPMGDTIIDIPPCVLVHRYYYSGNRSFQGPMLPGGPTIIVANHPKTGERCYVQATLMPGAPQVNYTSKAIEFDYGRFGATICFGRGAPSVVYRSGEKWTRRLNMALHTEQLQGHVQSLAASSKGCVEKSKTMTVGILAIGSDAMETATLPVTNTLQMLPFGAAIFGGDLEDQLAARAAEHRRELEIKQAQHRQPSIESIRTIR